MTYHGERGSFSSDYGMTVDEVLAELQAANGAVLWFQASNEHAFECHRLDGVIRFDPETDCYVHPAARRVVDGGYTMEETQ